MRIHSNLIRNRLVIIDALKREQAAGRIASHVSFKSLGEHGSRSHDRAFEIQLEASQRDNGRRAGNSGSYGAMRPEHDGYAATYDEWGWLLAALYEIDPQMIVGTPKSPVYRDRANFNESTGLTYAPAELIQEIDAAGDPYPYTEGRRLKGRAGYGRVSAEDGETYKRRGWPVKDAPRTVEDVRAFAHLEAVSA